jgi:hypothetical protein
MVKQRFRPHRSVSLPPGIMRAAITNKNTVIAICTPCTVVCRSSLMSVIMTFMFEPAKLQMNCASASGTRILRNAPEGRPTLTASPMGPYLPIARRGSRAEIAELQTDDSGFPPIMP